MMLCIWKQSSCYHHLVLSNDASSCYHHDMSTNARHFHASVTTRTPDNTSFGEHRLYAWDVDTMCWNVLVVVSTLNIIPLKTFGCCIECVRPTRKMAARDARFLSSITGRQRPKKTVSMVSIVGSAFTTFALTAWLAASFPKGRRCKSFAINS